MASHDRTRREFLKLASQGLAGAALGLSPLGAAALAQGVPPAFKDPEEIAARRPAPGVVEVDLDVRWTPAEVAGWPATLLTYNGRFVSPTIRVRRGDRLRVRFRNFLGGPPVFNALGHDLTVTNLHTHGLHVSPTGNSDNVMIPVRAGEEFLYEYDLSRQAGGTLNYYHPHVHGSVAEQAWAGLGGALVVEDETDALAGLETHLLVLKDLTLADGLPERHGGAMDFMHGKEGALALVNGQLQPRIALRPGQIQRWRVLNASTARFYNLALEGHLLHLVGTDGGLLDRPYPVARILLGPAERVDLLVQGSATPGSYRLVSLPYRRAPHAGGQGLVLMTVSCEGARAADTLPARVNPAAERLPQAGAALPRRRLVLGMGHGAGFINGISFSHRGAFTIFSRVGTHELWELVNATNMDHPFHHHVNAAQVLAISGGDPEYAAIYTSLPALKDTTIVPAGGSVLLLMPVLDFTGMTMFHCHILEHEDIGMMGNWEIA